MCPLVLVHVTKIGYLPLLSSIWPGHGGSSRILRSYSVHEHNNQKGKESSSRRNTLRWPSMNYAFAQTPLLESKRDLRFASIQQEAASNGCHSHNSFTMWCEIGIANWSEPTALPEEGSCPPLRTWNPWGIWQGTETATGRHCRTMRLEGLWYYIRGMWNLPRELGRRAWCLWGTQPHQTLHWKPETLSRVSTYQGLGSTPQTLSS